MLPKSISDRVYSPGAIELRRQMDKQRKILGGSRRDGLANLGIPGKGKDFTRASIAMLKSDKNKP